MECVPVTGCNGELSSEGNSTYWTAKDEVHSWDGGKWSLDSLISSTSLNYDDLEDKMKDTYKLPGNLEENETYGIVNIESITPYIKEDPPEDWTMTSSFLDNILLPSGIDLSADADVGRIMFCKMYAQDYFPG